MSGPSSEPGVRGQASDRETYDELYRSTPTVWSGRANRQLVVAATRERDPGAAVRTGNAVPDTVLVARRGSGTR